MIIHQGAEINVSIKNQFHSNHLTFLQNTVK